MRVSSPLFDIVVISCNRTYERLASLFGGLHALIQSGAVRHIYITLQSDVGSIDHTVFDVNVWNLHIDEIAPILALNIRECSSLPSGSLVRLLDQSRHNIFRPRLLKDSERSLLWKHYRALTTSSDLPVLILEDDAQFLSNFTASLCELAKISLKNNWFIDFGVMNGMTSRGRLVKGMSFSYSYQAIGCTRTTVASMWSPRISRMLIESYWPCALPADLHHQYLLSKLRIPGIWPSSAIFNHLSSPISGEYESSIQDHVYE